MQTNNEKNELETELHNTKLELNALRIDRERREMQLLLANKELIFQNKEREKR